MEETMAIDTSRSKLLFAAIILGSLAVGAQPSLARITNTNAGASATTNQSTMDTKNHLSSQGMANTNGRYATDRDTGLDRAEDRMSAQGRAHSRALKHHSSDNDADDKPTTTTSGIHR